MAVSTFSRQPLPDEPDRAFNRNTTKPDGVTGRVKEDWPPLPQAIAQFRIDAITEWMATHRNFRRPPDIAAPLLALVCWLYDRPEPYPLPSRERLAVWITGDDSRDDKGRLRKAGSVDAALTTALGEGEVREELRTVLGRVSGRTSARRYRYITPARQLLEAYNAPRRASYNKRG